MTYTFKLARRLAVLRNRAMIASMLAMVAILAACAADGISPDGGDDDWRDRTAVAVAVSPRTVTVETNQVARFSGRVYMPRGDSVSTPIEWAVDGGSITVEGLFQSSKAGTYKVIGRGRQKADTATVVVVPPQPTLTSLTIAPETVSLAAGATQQFTATGRLSDGSTAPVGFNWTATGGTIDASGNYTAGTAAGTYRVVVSNTTGSIADTAVITIAAPAPTPEPEPEPTPAPTLSSVIMTPASVSLVSGGAQQLAVYGRMSNGDSVAVPVTVTYSATGGAVTSTGLYTAGPTAGNYRVIVKAASGPADTTSIVVAAPAPTTPSGMAPGIAFGGFHMPAANLGSTFTGFLRTVYLPRLKAVLDSARAKKARVVLAVPRAKSRGADGTFSLDVWKQEVSTYRSVPVQSYIDDGTIIGLYVVDEPNCAHCWGGVKITQADVDEMARYVKSIWPTMATIARVQPSWFSGYGPPRYLDVAWAQWEGPLHVPSARMTPEQFRDKQVADAKAMRVGLIIGMNTLDAGDGSSNISGTYDLATVSTRWQMSVAEVERVGKVLAATPYACAMLNWRWSLDYPSSSSLTSTQFAAIRAFDDRADVKAALAKVAAVAANRPTAPCRVK